jgi:hypothetical protein
MTSATASTSEQPLVAVVCAVPLIFEGLREALAQVARVQFFPAARGTAGLLRWVRPDAVVVDDEAGAEDASVFARENELPLVHVSVHDREVRIYSNGVWLTADNGIGDGGGPTPETVRDILAGSLYGRRPRERD